MNGKARGIGWGLFTSLIVLAIPGLPARAQYGGGAGTAESPYLIETAGQMNAIGLNAGDWDKHFRLVADIDMNDLAGSTFHLVGAFQGVFDGGIGRTTTEMQDVRIYIAAGWDFAGETLNGTSDIWEMRGGEPAYPRLAWEELPADDDAVLTDVDE